MEDAAKHLFDLFLSMQQISKLEKGRKPNLGLPTRASPVNVNNPGKNRCDPSETNQRFDEPLPLLISSEFGCFIYLYILKL